MQSGVVSLGGPVMIAVVEAIADAVPAGCLSLGLDVTALQMTGAGNSDVKSAGVRSINGRRCGRD